MNKFFFFLFLSLLFSLTIRAGLKPKWVNNTPKELNPTYKFVEISSEGSNMSAARAEGLKKLAQNEQLVRTVQVNIETGKLREINSIFNNGRMSEEIKDRVNVDMKISGKQFRLQAVVVDEYYEGYERGMYKLRTLYMVPVQDNPVFDRTYKSTSYGATPAVMSIIPGLGQIYKGSTIKGICMFAGVAACGIGALVCESQRSDYKNKMKEQPQFAKDYNTKANNWETGRNVCLGAAAAVWIYNIIDAAVAKGARKIIVKPKDGNSFSLYPIATPHSMGLALTYNF